MKLFETNSKYRLLKQFLSKSYCIVMFIPEQAKPQQQPTAAQLRSR